MIEKIMEKYKTLIMKKLKIDSKQTEAIFEVCKDRLSAFTGIGEAEQEVKFERILKQYLQKKLSKNSKGEDFEGLFVFTGDVIHFNQKNIDKILFKFNEDPISRQGMLNSGEVKLIDGVPTVMDMKEFWKGGSKNFNYNKPLKVQRVKTIRGIVKDGTDEKGMIIYRKLELTLKENDVTKKLKFGVVCNFRAIKGKNSNEDTMIL